MGGGREAWEAFSLISSKTETLYAIHVMDAMYAP